MLINFDDFLPGWRFQFLLIEYIFIGMINKVY